MAVVFKGGVIRNLANPQFALHQKNYYFIAGTNNVSNWTSESASRLDGVVQRNHTTLHQKLGLLYGLTHIHTHTYIPNWLFYLD